MADCVDKSPGKILRNGKIVGKVVKKKNNDKKLTAAEIIGSHPHLMNIIVKHIPIGRERNNLNLTSRMLYNVCHSKSSIVSPFMFVRDDIFFTFPNNRREGQSTIQFSKYTVTIDIPHYGRGLLESFKRSMEKLKAKEFELKFLNLGCVQNDYLELLGTLKCFGNIHTVIFSCSSSKCIPIEIFKKCPELRPSKLIFDSFEVENTRGHGQNVENGVYNSNIIPNSVKEIEMSTMHTYIERICGIFENYEDRHFEKLFVDNGLLFTLVSPDLRPKVLELVKHFKSIDISYSGNFTKEIDYSIHNGLSVGYLSIPSVKCIYHLTFCCSDDIYVDVGETYIPESEKYLDINSLTVLRSRIRRSDGFIDLPSLCKELYFMENLTTFKIECDLISSFKDLSVALKNSLKNIKFYKCYLLKLDDFKILAEFCKSIENLWLTGVSDENITFKTIMELFRNLQGLSLEYAPSFNSKRIIEDLEKKDSENNGCGVIEWPNIFFLNLICFKFNEEEEELLSRMEYKSPRKSWYYLKRSFINDCCCFVSQIVIQKRSNYFDTFKIIFSEV